MRILSLAGRRLAASIPTLFLILIGVFLLLQFAPGDTVDAMMAQMGGGDAATARELRKFYGLDLSIPAQLGNYLWRLVRIRPEGNILKDVGAEWVQGDAGGAAREFNRHHPRRRPRRDRAVHRRREALVSLDRVFRHRSSGAHGFRAPGDLRPGELPLRRARPIGKRAPLGGSHVTACCRGSACSLNACINGRLPSAWYWET